jgi:hypothetical protein
LFGVFRGSVLFRVPWSKAGNHGTHGKHGTSEDAEKSARLRIQSARFVPRVFRGSVLFRAFRGSVLFRVPWSKTGNHGKHGKKRKERKDSETESHETLNSEP